MNAERRADLNVLIRRFADGDRSAFQPLFDGLWPVLVAFTGRALPSTADAEDAAQQTVLKVFSRIVDYDRTRDGLTWVLAMAAFEVMTIRKQSARRREIATVPLDVQDVGLDQEESLMRDQVRTALREAVGELSPGDQEALAPIFGDTEPPAGETARKRRTRAIERLRAVWRKVHG
jgi:DNA-directed RNA polymerase specialized sigma24 family protein